MAAAICTSRKFCGNIVQKNGLHVKVAFVILVTFMSSAIVSSSRSGKMRRIARIGEYDNCHDRSVRPFHLTERKIFIASKHVYAMVGEGRNDKPMRRIEKATVNITKCADRSKTKCEHYQHMEWTSGVVICRLLDSTMTPWESVLGAYKPRLKCPYGVGNFTIDMRPDFKALNKIPFVQGDSFWVVQFEFLDEKFSPWLCSYAESDFPLVRE